MDSILPTLRLSADDPVAKQVVAAIHTGNVEELRKLLAEHAGLVQAVIVDRKQVARTLPHVVADWPGHFPRGAESVAVLAAAGADVNLPVEGSHNSERPLHWAASSDDVAVLDALIAAGAEVDAPGSQLGGGTALADARIFGQWHVAQRLLDHGAKADFNDCATLGLLDRLVALEKTEKPDAKAITVAFWCACQGGQRNTAEHLLDRGAEVNWIPPWERLTPLDAAEREGAAALVAWLREKGAKTAHEV